MNIIGPGSSSIKVKKKKKKHYHEIKASARKLLIKAIESKEGGLEELLWGISLEQDYKKLEKVYNDRKLKYEAMMKQKEEELSLFLDEDDITLLWTELMISRVLKNNKFTFIPYRHSNIYTDSSQYIDDIRPESNENVRKSTSLSISSPNPISSGTPEFNNSINFKDFKQYMVDRDKKRRVTSIIKQVKREERRDPNKLKDEYNNDVNKNNYINNNKADSNNNKDDNENDDDKSENDSIISDITFRKKSSIEANNNNRNLAEVDIVADLFSMSNELRLEREQISFNSTQDAALNRSTTLKYAAVLEDVVQTKEETERARRRAALLRMQKNAMKYNNLGKSDTSLFLDFWENVQKLQSSTIENNEAENIAKAQRKAASDRINSNLAKSVLEAQINTLFKAKLLLNEKLLSSGKPVNEKSGFKFDLETTSYQKIYGSVAVTEKEQLKGKSTRKSFSGLSVHITDKRSPKKIISQSINYDSITSRHLDVDEEEIANARKRRRELAKLIRLAAGSKREKKAVERVLAQLPEDMKEEFEARVEAKRMAMKEAMKASTTKSKINEYDDSDDERNKETIRKGAFLTQKLLDFESDSDEDSGNETNMTPRIKGRYTVYGDEIGLLYSGSLLPMSSPSNLSGRWGYDPSIDEGPVEPLYISGGVNRDLPNFDPNLPRRLEVFPMHSRGLDVDEVAFDPDTFFVIVTRVREGFTLRDMSIHINDIYVTQSRFPDMVTLRTSPRSGYDGYLGTIQHSAWSEVVKTMDDAIDDAISKTIDARNRYNTVNDCNVDNNTVDNSVSANPSPRPARLVLDDFFITSSEAMHNINDNNKINLDDSVLLQNTFPTTNRKNVKVQSSDSISNTIASLPNIYASLDFAAPKTIEKTVETKANRLYNSNLKNTVFNNILSTSSLYADNNDNNNDNNNTINTLSNTEMINKPRRPVITHSPQKSPKIRNIGQKLLNDNNNNNNNNINDENEVDIDKNIASGYAALGEQIEFFIGGNQPPTVTRFVSKDVRSPLQKSISKRKCELIAEATIEANKGNLKNTKVIHKVYDKTKTTRGVNIAKELARKAKQQEVVEEDFTKLVLLIESERLMQLYFAKKFLQLDLMIDPVLTIYDALETIKHKPRQYGLILVNYLHLEASGDIKRSLMSILPVEVNENDYTIIVYGAVNPDDEMLTLFEHCGVTDILEEPYTAEKIRNIYLAHENKVSIKKVFK